MLERQLKTWKFQRQTNIRLPNKTSISPIYVRSAGKLGELFACISTPTSASNSWFCFDLGLLW